MVKIGHFEKAMSEHKLFFNCTTYLKQVVGRFITTIFFIRKSIVSEKYASPIGKAGR